MTKIRDRLFLTAFGNHLKVLRTKKGFSQEELAYSADIPISQAGRIERGEINTTISTIYALSKALDVHPKALLDFEV